MAFVFKVLRNRVLQYMVYTCPNQHEFAWLGHVYHEEAVDA